MTLHLHLPGSHHHQKHNEQQQEVRDARKLLKEKIRTDWYYPPLPQHQTSGRKPPEPEDASQGGIDKIAGLRIHSAVSDETAGTHGLAGEILGLGFEPLEWRERGYSSVSETEEDEPTPAKTVKEKHEVYKFEDPESIGTHLSQHRQTRKRKRQERLEAEMEWNDGLAHWTRQRDIWSCAHTSTQVHELDIRQDDHSPINPDTGPGAAAPDTASSSSTSTSSPRTSTSSNHLPTLASPDHPPSPITSPASTPDPTHPPDSTSRISSPTTIPHLPAPTTTITPPSPPPTLLLPLAPPLLPNHPIRRRITTSTYPEIYSKIILQGRAPSVPINLGVLLRALVQGWKADGEWPPKSSVPVTGMVGSVGKSGGGGAGGKKGARTGIGGAGNWVEFERGKGGDAGGGEKGSGSLKQGVKAVGRALRLTGHDGK